ncbi:peptidyl-prolyl cis-trans isomerase SurA [Granulicella rosea]|uniref:peptidylprolyl isomerase n=1 Tax=Granulicella rosea TaxID=474952 RepID=A0A239IKH9_9BACT|nr:peptidylprolyl isomerase [Granulicella rosea]SNS93738.1 peptidyl-prolyl cis-trans isomerase SurA [Granulicella rosea]
MNFYSTRTWGWVPSRKAIQQAAFAVVASTLLAGTGFAQVVKAPRYQSGMNAPTPQVVAAPLPPAITPGATVVEDVVVRVNDQIISRSDLERSQAQLIQELQQSNAGSAEAAQKQKDMLRDMIDQQLLLSRAKELGLNADAEVIRRLDEIRKQNKLDSMEDLEKAARSQGVSFEDFKAQIRNGLLTQQVVRDEVGRRLQMSQSEEVAYYNAHKAELSQPEQVRLSEILIPVPENATPEVVAQAQAKANEVKSKAAAGASFDDLAKQYSGGPTATQGGDLGLFKRGALAKVLEDQTFALKAGDSTQPIRTRQGYVILKVTEHMQAGAPPMKDVEPQIQEALYMQAMQPALRAYLTKLREDAYIDIKPGFVDSGASPKETKPVFSAYSAPVVKKKKVVQKARFDSARGAKPVVASPDTTGGRTLTGADAQPAPAVDKKTGLAVITPVSTASKPGAPGKRHKIKREKVRFGQAPRNSLPAGTATASVGSDIGGSTTLAGQSGSGTTIAPGAAIASIGTSPEIANPENPLAQQEQAPTKKTRFAARPDVHKESAAKALSAKRLEKLNSTPVAMTDEEKAAAQTQAAPLGLNGDTTKKKKVKPTKRKKGDPKPDKARLQEKPKDVAAPAPEIAPTANPLLAPTSDLPPSTKTAPTSNQTTLPPANAPVPGANPTGQPVPATQPQPPQ